jgi:hypothetical protein
MFSRHAKCTPIWSGDSSSQVRIAPGTPLARVDFGSCVTGEDMLALSPDGARLSLTLRGADEKVRLHTRLLKQIQVSRRRRVPRPIPRSSITSGCAVNQAFSPFPHHPPR